MGLFSKSADLLFGKKEGAKKADPMVSEIRQTQGYAINAQNKGIQDLNKALDTDASVAIKAGIEQQKAGILSAAQDARRRAQMLMAQRGLKGTSLGLGLDRSATQEMGNQMAALNASLPGMIRQQSIQDAQARLNAGSNLFNAVGGTGGMQMQDQAGERTGGLVGITAALAPAAGSFLGATQAAHTQKRGMVQAAKIQKG